MSNISTFGAFTTARLGIFAAQRALDVTGHNITNINTLGYTRQRLDQMSFRTGGADRYASKYNVNIGSGVLCTGVSQLRDPYLDIRFRNESSTVGAMDGKLSGLEDISKILDEVGKGEDKGGVLQAKFNDLIKQLGALSDKVGQEEYDTLVRSSADVLVKLLNGYASDLEDVHEIQDDNFKQDLDTVNSLLKNIGALNDTIQKSELHGDKALELRDQRNLMLDQLSKFMKIEVDYQSVSVGEGASIEKMVIRTAGNPKYNLVDGSYVSQVSLRNKVPKPNPDATGPADLYMKADGTFTNDPALAEQVDNTNYDLEFSKLTNSKGLIWGEKRVTERGFGADKTAAEAAFAALTNGVVDKNGVRLTTDYTMEERSDKDGNKSYFIITQERRSSIEAQVGDNDLYGSLQASREILTEMGEFTPNYVVAGGIDAGAATKRGIPYYQKSLDALAQKLASVLNGANTGYLQDKTGNFVDTDGKPIVHSAGGVDTILTKDTVLDGAMEITLKNKGTPVGGPLFSNGTKDDTTNIKASNISISRSWALKDVQIVNSFIMGTETNGKPSSTDTSNILHLVSLMDSSQEYKASDVAGNTVVGGTNSAFFKGSFQKMLVNMSVVLADDVKITTTQLNNYASSATELDISRSSVSGVDLNDEAAALMQYQKSYSAACRLMTTLDEALDKLINGTGVVGR